MEVDDFRKKRFTSYELIEYYPNGFDDFGVPCTLIAIDFEQCLFKLLPIPEGFYEEIPFWSRVEYCKRPVPKKEMKISYKSVAKDIVQLIPQKTK